MKQEDKNDGTKERILNEAEALFAEKGYHAVSVREISAAAECNLAAMNYHFGHKQNLYLEVFRTRWGVERYSPPVMRSSMSPRLQTRDPGTGGAGIQRPRLLTSRPPASSWRRMVSSP